MRRAAWAAVLVTALPACTSPAAPADPSEEPTPSVNETVAATEEEGAHVGLVLTDARMVTDDSLELELDRLEVTPDGLLVDLTAFNGGSDEVTLVDDAATVYALTSLGEELPLVPPADLPVTLASGQRAALQLAFAGRLAADDEWVAVHLGDDARGRAGTAATFQLDLDAVATTTSGDAPFAGRTFPQDASTEVEGVDLRVTAVEVEQDAVYLRLEATNRRTEEARLFADEEAVYLLDSRNRRLPAVLPTDDPTGALAPGEQASIRLGFRGTLDPAARSVSLILNHDDRVHPLSQPGDPLVATTIQNLPLDEE